MTDDELFQQHIALLEQRRQSTEFEFSSPIPILGPLISRVRSLWLSVATRWYVRYYAQQQQSFNHAVIDTLRLLSAQSEQRDQRIRYTIEQLQSQLTGLQLSIHKQLQQIQEHVDFIQQTQEKDFETIAQTLNKDYDNG